MEGLRSICRMPISTVTRKYALNRLKQYCSAERHATEAVIRSIVESLEHNVCKEEVDWINKIENKRKELNSRTDMVAKVDFGAGSNYSTTNKNGQLYKDSTERTIGEISLASSKPSFWCLLLLKIIRNIKPEKLIEMGTSVGISGAYQAAALTINGSSGRLITLEGDQSIASIARNTYTDLALNNIEVRIGSFDKTLEKSLSTFAPVDYVFIDGHHEGDATVRYFESILPYLSNTAVLIFDDIAWSSDMKTAWQVISSASGVSLAVDMGVVGVCILDEGNTKSRALHLPLRFA